MTLRPLVAGFEQGKQEEDPTMTAEEDPMQNVACLPTAQTTATKPGG